MNSILKPPVTTCRTACRHTRTHKHGMSRPTICLRLCQRAQDCCRLTSADLAAKAVVAHQQACLRKPNADAWQTPGSIHLDSSFRVPVPSRKTAFVPVVCSDCMLLRDDSRPSTRAVADCPCPSQPCACEEACSVQAALLNTQSRMMLSSNAVNSKVLSGCARPI